MSVMASQTTCNSIVCLTACSEHINNRNIKAWRLLPFARDSASDRFPSQIDQWPVDS